jgi:ribosomal protein L37AE/L43A
MNTFSASTEVGRVRNFQQRVAMQNRSRQSHYQNEESSHSTCPACGTEHPIDLGAEAIVSCHVTHAYQGDASTGPESLILVGANLQLIESERTVEEAVKVNRCHINVLLERLTQRDIRTCIPEKKQKNRKWVANPESSEHVFRGNRRRVQSDKDNRLSRRRSELVRRTFALV